MKKLFTILCVSLLSVGVFAQAETEAGTFIMQMGGDGISFSSTSVSSADNGSAYGDFDDTYDKINTATFGINTMAGFFVADGLAIGLRFALSSSTTTVELSSDLIGATDPDDQVSTSLTIAPVVRYYFGESGVWSQVSYGFGSTGDGDSDTEDPSVSELGFGAGYAISLNDYVSLNPMIVYKLNTTKIKDGGMDLDGSDADSVTKSGIFAFGLSLNVHLGR
tara:strand:+ start:346 stop:1008 length:663 start_codon:yes stop_codon:yes gene_type:complete